KETIRTAKTPKKKPGTFKETRVVETSVIETVTREEEGGEAMGTAKEPEKQQEPIQRPKETPVPTAKEPETPSKEELFTAREPEKPPFTKEDSPATVKEPEKPTPSECLAEPAKEAARTPRTPNKKVIR
ncbi:hypothetical protein ANCCAN_29831, partial [Ancylostoma caninum]